MEIYTVNEVMKILKLTRRTILGYINSGKIKASKVGNQYRISKEDLSQFLLDLRK